MLVYINLLSRTEMASYRLVENSDGNQGSETSLGGLHVSYKIQVVLVSSRIHHSALTRRKKRVVSTRREPRGVRTPLGTTGRWPPVRYTRLGHDRCYVSRV